MDGLACVAGYPYQFSNLDMASVGLIPKRKCILEPSTVMTVEMLYKVLSCSVLSYFKVAGIWLKVN